ncbi:hypothetical protein GC722_05300 [Auraticoccus sp. F435]|uniref:Uncharacterized protein n=1 Tax=Auraticoccus cholistanensis TaxID=2656650 RepID=A0A6A9URB9_9ACTN|nr:hypothetical protein [Auraticoccus cholistanensis]MVA75446.1 hypothetical protein [Auraticoccus cholistanensis]
MTGPGGDDDAAPAGGALRLALDPRRVLLWLPALVLLISVTSLLSRLLVITPELDSSVLRGLSWLVQVDAEETIPTWLQAVWLAACAAALWTVADAVRARRERWSRHWRLLAAVFAFLSVDEVVGLHERLTAPVRDALGLGGALYYAWVVVAVPLVVVLLLVLLPFLLALPRRTLATFVAAGAVFVLGAVGLEMSGAALSQAEGVAGVGYAVLVTVEEFLEMLGVVLFLAAVADHGQRQLGLVPGPAARRAEEGAGLAGLSRRSAG